MCGIMGYIGVEPAAPIIVQGLSRLEYRGYDSAGLCVLGSNGAPRTFRTVGRVSELESSLPTRLSAKIGIGHTRWATHGEPTVENAHPHASQDGRVHVVHNGIIDNANELRRRLVERGVVFDSDTDTEVLAHLISQSEAETLERAVGEAISMIVGTYALAVMDTRHPDRLVLARNGSPLLIGVGSGEMYVASDPSALVFHTRSVVSLDDGELATVTKKGYRTFTRDGVATTNFPMEVGMTFGELELDGHEHFMHKEIHEQPESVARMLSGRLDARFGTARLDGLNLEPRELRAFRRVKILGCGSAQYVGQLGATLIEDLARIPADCEPASEFRYRNPVVEHDTLYVAVSQSGETADTLFAVQEIRRKGGRVIGLVNVVGSAVARECDGGIYLHAGPEVSVASTKALTHMAVGFGLLGLLLGRIHDLSHADGMRILKGLERIPEAIEAVLKNEAKLADLGRDLARSRSLFFVGRVRAYPVAREGAQKFKEITYRHAEAYPTSELKHGPLALIDKEFPTVAVIPHDDLASRNAAAVEQIKSRGGRVVVITHPDVDMPLGAEDRCDVPRVEIELDPIVLTIPLQLLAYHAAVHLELDVDKPRNLAKSVTVE